MREARPGGRPPRREGPAGERLARRRQSGSDEPPRARRQAPSARQLALDVLDRVLGPDAQPFDEAFAAHPALDRLALRDRAFARIMVTTVLRRHGQIDQIVLPLLRYRPHSHSVHNMLRLGTAQLVFLTTPPHAAVAETVRLAARGHAREVPLLNAVLRKVAALGTEATAGQDAATLNTPAWLMASWAEAYGPETARAIALAHQHEPPLDLSVKADPERWAEALGADVLPTGTLRRPAGGQIEALPGFEEGAWWVQDAAAALPVRCLGPLSGLRVLDIGAAPGGKTAQLCAAGASVTAIERSPKRAEFLAGNLARLGMDAEIVVADAAEWRPERPFDAVLLDAPCTATGTIRRHPDIPWLKSPADVTRLAGVQDRLLRAAVGLVRPGGMLVYAVCSLQPEEGAQRIAVLLDSGAPVERVAIGPDALAGLAVDPTAEGEIRTLPVHLAERGGLDGFFIAALRRR